MKTILKNSMMVTVLAGILVLPMFCFEFFGYSKIDVPKKVLGVKSDTSQIDSPKVVEQIDLKLALSLESLQKFYDVIPEKYLSKGYSEYIVFSKDLFEEGYSFELIDNGLSKDLIVRYFKDSSYKNLKSKLIDLSVIIIKSSI